jgi:hypothetical protein
LKSSKKRSFMVLLLRVGLTPDYSSVHAAVTGAGPGWTR